MRIKLLITVYVSPFFLLKIYFDDRQRHHVRQQDFHQEEVLRLRLLEGLLQISNHGNKQHNENNIKETQYWEE
jgi:hypothetical protein